MFILYNIILRKSHAVLPTMNHLGDLPLFVSVITSGVETMPRDYHHRPSSFDYYIFGFSNGMFMMCDYFTTGPRSLTGEGLHPKSQTMEIHVVLRNVCQFLISIEDHTL